LARKKQKYALAIQLLLYGKIAVFCACKILKSMLFSDRK